MGCVDSEEFSDVARDHAAHPRNYGPLVNFDAHARVTGPCGDTMEYWLVICGGSVSKVAFITDGCGSSRACGSMAACLAEGRDLDEVVDMKPRDVLNALGEFPSQFAHCALLAVTVLRAAVEDYVTHQQHDARAMHDREQAHEPSDRGTEKDQGYAK